APPPREARGPREPHRHGAQRGVPIQHLRGGERAAHPRPLVTDPAADRAGAARAALLAFRLFVAANGDVGIVVLRNPRVGPQGAAVRAGTSSDAVGIYIAALVVVFAAE